MWTIDNFHENNYSMATHIANDIAICQRYFFTSVHIFIDTKKVMKNLSLIYILIYTKLYHPMGVKYEAARLKVATNKVGGMFVYIFLAILKPIISVIYTVPIVNQQK